MKVFVTGGTGFVGSTLTRFLAARGHEITILTRSGPRGEARQGMRFVQGDSMKPGPWQDEVGGHDAVINLAGASIFTPWTSRARRMILDSRVLTTRHVVDALARAPGGRVLLSTSAVGYYGGRLDDTILDEGSSPGSDFLSEVGVQWEAEALRARDSGARVVICRLGIVMGRNGGALAQMAPAFRRFMGSPLGSGRQWFPWIHEEDLAEIMAYVLEHSEISGPVNCVAPNPVRNREMTEILARVLHRPLILPSVPGFVLRTVMGEFGDVLLKGQRAIPRRLQEAGFRFRHPTFQEALVSLLSG
ncbi:MAG: TIGR01777 family oxidoreductase [Syntrophobacteraceae bacterium]|jgi:hypothetical protein|nr:TIGR01777 family oxidoreductase [Syntrophobacteraceae bacterium]